MDHATAALALSSASLVVGVYGAAMPTLADARGSADHGGHMAKAQQYAALVSGAAVLGIAAVTKSPAVAIVGCIAVIGMSSAFKSACDH